MTALSLPQRQALAAAVAGGLRKAGGHWVYAPPRRAPRRFSGATVRRLERLGLLILDAGRARPAFSE